MHEDPAPDSRYFSFTFPGLLHNSLIFVTTGEKDPLTHGDGSAVARA